MCTSCVSTIDAVAANAAGIAAFVAHLRERAALADPVTGDRTREEIRRSQVAFMRSMGLDPVEVLGPDTAAPGRRVAAAPVRTTIGT